MSYLASLPERTVLLEVLRAFQRSARPSTRSPAVRPVPAQRGRAGVDGRVCVRAQRLSQLPGRACGDRGRAFGIDGELLEGLLADLDTAGVEERLKPMLGFVSKLTQTPAKITPSDAERSSRPAGTRQGCTTPSRRARCST